MKKQIAVIGQGQFGVGVAITLTNMGHEVLAIDVNERKVQSVAPQVTHAIQADATDEAVLKDLGMGNFDIAIVSLGSRIESSILATILLRKLGVPYIIARAETELHGSILEKIGADRVVYPEWQMGIRVAQETTLSDVADFMLLTQGYSIVKLIAPPSFVGSSLTKLELGHKRKWKIAVFLIQRNNEVIISPSQSETIKDDDVLLLAGTNDNLEKLLTWARENEEEEPE